MSERQGRYAVKADANQPEVVKALQEAGYIVHDTHALGHGFPDLCVMAASGAIVLLEVKTQAGRLTADEVAFFETWHGAHVYQVRSGAEAVALCRSL